jgi:AraC family transcriptional regulator, arabinose operon regulatory protein
MSFLSTGETPYSILRRLDIGAEPRSIGSNRHLNDRPTNSDKVWNRYAGCLVTKGRGTYRDWNDCVLDVRPGTFVHHFPERYHHIERDVDGWEEYSVFMDHDLYRHFRGIGVVHEGSGVVMVGNGRSFVDLVDRFRRLATAITRGASGNAIIVQVAELFASVSEIGGTHSTVQPTSPVIERARERLANDLCAEADLEELARACGMSYAHFRRRFQREVGQSPAAFRNEQRLQQARALLTYEAIPVSEVAARLGYSDAFIFSRQFRRRFGVSPKPYHEAHFQA